MEQPPLTWMKSTWSEGEGECVEVARLPEGGRAVRHSKNPTGEVLEFTPGEWAAFMRGAKDGQFD